MIETTSFSKKIIILTKFSLNCIYKLVLTMYMYLYTITVNFFMKKNNYTVLVLVFVLCKKKKLTKYLPFYEGKEA